MTTANKFCDENNIKKETREKIIQKIKELKIIYKGIPIDILVACVSFKSIDENFNLDNDSILKNCCEKCILSLNGCRVTNAIFKSLPRERIEDFRYS